jgi:hypothetical protein
MARTREDCGPRTCRFPTPVLGLVVLEGSDELDGLSPPVLVSHGAQPSGLGRALWALVRRDGFDGVVGTLGWGRAWLQLDPGVRELPVDDGLLRWGIDRQDRSPLPHPGYGWRSADSTEAIARQIQRARISDGTWWYFLERSGVMITRRRGSAHQVIGFVPFVGPGPDWDQLDLADQLSGSFLEVTR